MKTVITIVMDENHRQYGWRLDRSDSDEILISKSRQIIKSTANTANDTFENKDAISADTPDVLFKHVMPDIKRQLKAYDLFDSGQNELCIL